MMNTSVVVLRLRNDPSDQRFLMWDSGGYSIRRMWINKSGETKSSTIPLEAAELRVMAEFVGGQKFDVVGEIQQEAQR